MSGQSNPRRRRGRRCLRGSPKQGLGCLRTRPPPQLELARACQVGGAAGRVGLVIRPALERRDRRVDALGSFVEPDSPRVRFLQRGVMFERLAIALDRVVRFPERLGHLAQKYELLRGF